jgi:hypothetical protein
MKGEIKKTRRHKSYFNGRRKIIVKDEAENYEETRMKKQNIPVNNKTNERTAKIIRILRGKNYKWQKKKNQHNRKDV